MRRRRWTRWVRRLVAAAAAAMLLLLAAYVFLLPVVARAVARGQLAGLGFPEAAFDLRGVSLHGAEAAEVRLDPGGTARADRVTVGFSPGSLLRGRLRTIEVTGAEVTLRLVGGALDLGALGRFSSGKAGGSADLPFDRLVVRSSALVVDWEGRPLRFAVDGAVVPETGGSAALTAATAVAGAPLHLRGTYEAAARSMTLAARVEGLDAAAAAALVPPAVFARPTDLGGSFDLALKATFSSGRQDLALTWTGRGIRWGLPETAFSARAVTGEVAAVVGPGARLEHVEGRAYAAEARAGGLALTSANVSVATTGERLTAGGRAAGPGWDLSRLQVSAPRDLGGTDGAGPIEVAWSFSGRPPGLLVDHLAALGVDLSGFESVSASGLQRVEVSALGSGGFPPVEVADLHIVTSPGDVALRDSGVALGGVAGEARLRGRIDREGLSLRLVGAGQALAQQLRAPGAPRLTRPIFLHLPEGAEVRIPFSRAGTLTLAGSVVSEADVMLDLGGGSAAAVRGLRLAGQVTLRQGRPLVQGTADVERLAFDLGGTDLALEAGPLALAADTHEEDAGDRRLQATLRLADLAVSDRRRGLVVRYGPERLRPVTGWLNLADGTGAFALDWPLRPEAALTAEGYLDLGGRSPAGVSFAWPGVQLEPGDTEAELVAALTGLEVRGSLSVSGEARVQWGRLRPRLTLAAADASLVSRPYRIEAEGVTGRVALTDLSPLATPGDQRIAVRRLAVGQLALVDGLTSFRLESDPPAAFIERTEWGLMGGRLYTNALRIDPAGRAIEARVFADGLSVRALLALLFGESVEAQGTLYGMLPVTVSPERPEDLRFGRGYLFATPEGGWWQIAADSSAVARQVLERALLSGAKTEADVRQRRQMFAGLLHFQFTTLKVELIEAADGRLARLTTSGRSLDPRAPAQFGSLVLDFPGFEKTLRQAIIIQRGIGRIGERAPVGRSP